jgi:hypothetical protein
LRQHQLKEEKTALAQAEMGMEIAKQNKTEETEEGGGAASQAADWGIAPTLSKMKEKEQKDRAALDALSDQGQSHVSGPKLCDDGIFVGLSQASQLILSLQIQTIE